MPWVSPANLHPFASIQADLQAGPQAAVQGIGGELLLLAPLGLLLPLIGFRLHRGLLRTGPQMVLAGTLISLVLALLQTGVPGHVVNIDAAMLNAAGVPLAHLLFYPPLRAALRRGPADRSSTDRSRTGAGRNPKEQTRIGLREEGTQGATPRPSRVGMAP